MGRKQIKKELESWSIYENSQKILSEVLSLAADHSGKDIGLELTGDDYDGSPDPQLLFILWRNETEEEERTRKNFEKLRTEHEIQNLKRRLKELEDA